MPKKGRVFLLGRFFRPGPTVSPGSYRNENRKNTKAIFSPFPIFRLLFQPTCYFRTIFQDLFVFLFQAKGLKPITLAGRQGSSSLEDALRLNLSAGTLPGPWKFTVCQGGLDLVKTTKKLSHQKRVLINNICVGELGSYILKESPEPRQLNRPTVERLKEAQIPGSSL